MKVSVTITKTKQSKEDAINLINKTNADYLHVDVMDGNFVENKLFPFHEFLEIQKDNYKPLDVHLMCSNPKKYIEQYVKLNTEYITIHAELNLDLKQLISLIHSYGVNAGLSIKPSTPVEKIKNYLSDIDQVLIMSVEPGYGGQEFKESVVYKIEELKKIRDENGLSFIISIDGGINDKTIDKVKGVDMVVSGSYICMTDNYQEKIDKLRV